MGHKVLSVPEGDGTSGESLGPPSRPEDGAFVELPQQEQAGVGG
jgi:hypothetical protein